MNKIIECVPNFSEGRDKEKIEKIVECFRGKDNVKLLDYSNDEDHNRLVVTVVGEPAPLRDAVIEAIGDAGRMAAALKESRALTIYRQYADAYGLGYKETKESSLSLPAFQGALGITHAKPK